MKKKPKVEVGSRLEIGGVKLLAKKEAGHGRSVCLGCFFDDDGCIKGDYVELDESPSCNDVVFVEDTPQGILRYLETILRSDDE